jgi:hypothetical protein
VFCKRNVAWGLSVDSHKPVGFNVLRKVTAFIFIFLRRILRESLKKYKILYLNVAIQVSRVNTN